MRRLFLAVAAAAVLAAAGCSTTPEAETAPAAATAPGSGPTAAPADAGTPAGPGPKTAPTGKAGDAALAGNTQAICNQAQQASGEFAGTWGADRKLLEAAKGATGQPDLVGKVQQKATRDVDKYAFALTHLSKLVADANVKVALADMSKQVTALRGDVQKADPSKVEGWVSTLGKACEK